MVTYEETLLSSKDGDCSKQTDFYTIKECSECGTKYALPRVAAPANWYADIGEFYGWRWEFDQCIRDVSSYMNSGGILEIGCGEGELIRKLNMQYEVYGCDINENAVKTAKGKGLKVVNGDPSTLSALMGDKKFNAVLLFHVIEHVADPSALLESISKMLNNKGRLFLSIPDPQRATAMVVEESWDKPPHHLTKFSEKGIVSLLRRNGYEVKKIAYQPLDTTPYKIASLAADVVINRANLNNDQPKYIVYFKKIFPFLFAFPKAVKACFRGSGTALYMIAQKID